MIKSNDLHFEILGLDKNYAYVWLGIHENSFDITIKNQMLNALMIKNGYSSYSPTRMPDYVNVNPIYENVFLSLQKDAQDKRIGIWSLPENSPEELAKSKAKMLQEEKETAERERKEKLKEEKDKQRKQQEYLKKANSVVITPKGKKYHYSWCQTVRNSYKTITIKQARKRGYKPCNVCEPPEHEVTLENSNGYWEDEVIHVYLGENQRILK